MPDRLNCMLVCKDWKNNINEKGFTKSFNLGNPALPGYSYLHYPPEFIDMILTKSFRSLKYLNLSRYKKLNDSLLIKHLPKLKKLKTLNLSECINLTDDSIKIISKSCTRLNELSLKSIKNITDNSIVLIVSNCPSLKTLNLNDCKNLTDISLIKIGSNLNLRELHIKDLHKVS